MARPVIVVGIDGSDGSNDALRWALHEAGLRSLTVELVYGWMVPEAAIASGGLAGGAALQACEEAGQAVLDSAVVRPRQRPGSAC